jgi:hypothetical protein
VRLPTLWTGVSPEFSPRTGLALGSAGLRGHRA